MSLRTRIRAAYSALRGRPTALGLNVQDGTLVFDHTQDRAFIANCSVSNNTGAGIRISPK